jgi:hypothetical protein
MQIPRNDFFPKLNNCFWADVRTSTESLRLFAHLDKAKWAASVYNMRTKVWIAESGLAKNADDAKQKAEQTARDLLPGAYQVEWQRLVQA